MATFTARHWSAAELRSPRGEVWEALLDATLIAKMTPYITSIDTSTDVDGDRWLWRMGTISVLGVAVAPRFTELITFEPQERIHFRPDPSRPDELTAVEGTFLLADRAGGGTDVSIQLEISCGLPLPGMARPAVERAMEQVVRHMGAVFSRNLLEHLGEG